MQEHVDRGMLSRISSIDELLSFVAIPVGMVVVGPLAAVFGAGRVAVVAGGCYLFAAWSSLLSKEVRGLRGV